MTRRTANLLRKSGFAVGGMPREPLKLQASDLGQCCPQQCPHAGKAPGAGAADPLGSPLSIKEVAHILGCSAWTVRQRYLPAGLPHHRATPNGKLVFYRHQIVRWLLRQQQKGEKGP